MSDCLQTARDFLHNIGEELSYLETREDQLLTLRDYGDQLPAMPPELKTVDNMVKGCASATYVIVTLNETGGIHLVTDSESFISKGYLYILTQALEGLTPHQVSEEIKPDVDAFAEVAGVRLSMIASRANIFERIYHFICKRALELAQ
jgi:sulfur transfer protein SufE